MEIITHRQAVQFIFYM